jgi:hypothetical protein
MTCGLGNFGKQSISSIAKDFRLELMGDAIDRNNYTIGDVAKQAHNFFFNEHYNRLQQKPAGDHSFEFYVGGYGSNNRDHELWKFAIVNGASPDPLQIDTPGTSGTTWAGQPEPINRLMLGFSPSLADVLVKAGMPQPQVQSLIAQLPTSLTAPLVWDAMPVQDAIDLAEFLVEVTKKYYRFHPGADIVGGHTDIAVVTRHEGFKWIERKHYYRVELNPLETDHADVLKK